LHDGKAENCSLSSRFRKEHKGGNLVIVLSDLEEDKAEAWIVAPKPELSRLAEYSDWPDWDRALYSRVAIGVADRFRTDFGQISQQILPLTPRCRRLHTNRALQQQPEEWGPGLRRYDGDMYTLSD
jgi:hypothetical protein